MATSGRASASGGQCQRHRLDRRLGAGTGTRRERSAQAGGAGGGSATNTAGKGRSLALAVTTWHHMAGNGAGGTSGNEWCSGCGGGRQCHQFRRDGSGGAGATGNGGTGNAAAGNGGAGGLAQNTTGDGGAGGTATNTAGNGGNGGAASKWWCHQRWQLDHGQQRRRHGGQWRSRRGRRGRRSGWPGVAPAKAVTVVRALAESATAQSAAQAAQAAPAGGMLSLNAGTFNMSNNITGKLHQRCGHHGVESELRDVLAGAARGKRAGHHSMWPTKPV